MFILDRNNEVVIIQTEYFSVEGRIRASRVSGYGIQFFHEIDQSVVDDIVNLNGVKIEDSIFARKL